MQPTQPQACWQCGIVLAVAGGRCPQCGAEQAPAPPPGTSLAPTPHGAMPVRPRGEPPLRKKPPNKALPWVVLSVGLAAIGLAGALLSPKKESPTAIAAPPPTAAPAGASARPVDPNDLGIPNPSAVDPTDLLARARARAVLWNRDAILASMRVSGLASGKVDVPHGGSIEYWFGKPTGEGFGAGARVNGKHLHIGVSDAGTTVEETGAGGGRAALDPNCPLEEAARKAQASGISASTPLAVSYDFSEKHKKPVFRIASVGDEAHGRTLDGITCAILVR